MKRPLRKALSLAGMTAVVAIAIGLYPRFFGRKRLRFPYLTGTLAPAEYQALASHPGWSPAKVTVAPGIQLMGLVRRPNAPDAPWLLYYPGNDAAQLRRGQAFLSQVSGDQDWGLAVFAYRGYDSSDGVPLVADLGADAPEILFQLCQAEKIPPGRVNVIGFSIGGYLAVRAVGAATRRNQRPASLSLLASVNDIVMVRRSLWERVDPGDDFQTSPFLNDVPAPVLIVQGGADETLGGSVQAQAIAKALGDRARYVELPGVGHNALIETEAAIAEVRAFIGAQTKSPLPGRP
jgi:pimeloyl-ACP methyl ester carboxylesterase